MRISDWSSDVCSSDLVHTHELETQVERAQCAEGAMLALEEMREVAAALYLNEFGSSWKPVSSSRFNHSAMLTSALVEGRDFLRARAEAKRRAAVPERSEEHTSELQSLMRISYAVFCLNKKK